MTDPTLTDLTLGDALVRLRTREISAVELTQAHLDRIAQVNPKIDAYLTIIAQRRDDFRDVEGLLRLDLLHQGA